MKIMTRAILNMYKTGNKYHSILKNAWSIYRSTTISGLLPFDWTKHGKTINLRTVHHLYPVRCKLNILKRRPKAALTWPRELQAFLFLQIFLLFLGVLIVLSQGANFRVEGTDCEAGVSGDLSNEKNDMVYFVQLSNQPSGADLRELSPSASSVAAAHLYIVGMSACQDV